MFLNLWNSWVSVILCNRLRVDKQIFTIFISIWHFLRIDSVMRMVLLEDKCRSNFTWKDMYSLAKDFFKDYVLIVKFFTRRRFLIHVSSTEFLEFLLLWYWPSWILYMHVLKLMNENDLMHQCSSNLDKEVLGAREDFTLLCGDERNNM